MIHIFYEPCLWYAAKKRAKKKRKKKRNDANSICRCDAWATATSCRRIWTTFLQDSHEFSIIQITLFSVICQRLDQISTNAYNQNAKNVCRKCRVSENVCSLLWCARWLYDTFQCLATNLANKNRWFIQWLLEIFTFMGLFFGYNKYNVSFHEISFKLSISKSHFPDLILGVW